MYKYNRTNLTKARPLKCKERSGFSQIDYRNQIWYSSVNWRNFNYRIFFLINCINYFWNIFLPFVSFSGHWAFSVVIPPSSDGSAVDISPVQHPPWPPRPLSSAGGFSGRCWCLSPATDPRSLWPQGKMWRHGLHHLYNERVEKCLHVVY